MSINGGPIDDYIFMPSPAMVRYNLSFEEQEARAAAGLTMAEYQALPGSPAWINATNPVWSKCHVIIWYRMHMRIPAAMNDAQAREAKRNARMRTR